jgi:O-antigen ligase
MALLSIVMTLSFIITILRYANFFPFLTDSIYELQTNAYGVTAGGAIMSVVFDFLSYMTGFAFFFILVREIYSRDYLKKIVAVLCSATVISCFFGMYQHFFNPAVGNNPLSIYQGSINATFKDGLSFGAFITLAVPFLAGIAIALQGGIRTLALILIPVMLYLVFFTASKSAFLCLIVGLVAFVALSFYRMKAHGNAASRAKKRFLRSSAAIGALALLAGALIFKGPLSKEIRNSQTFSRVANNLKASNFKTILAGRSDTLWASAWLMMKAHPIAGAGMGSYIIESSNYSTLAKIDIGTPESAENYFLEIGSELGAVGLILTLGIFALIIRRIVTGAKALGREDRWKMVYVGGSASVLAFLVNLQFHTYVQSYEIHYMLWLVTAIVISLGTMMQESKTADDSGTPAAVSRREEKKAGQGRRSRIGKAAVAIIILVFTVSQVWNSTESLSLESRTKIFGWKQEFGLDKAEKTPDGREFRWSKGAAALTVTLDGPDFVIPLHASHPDIAKNPVTVRIYLIRGFFRGKTLLSEIRIKDPSWMDIPLSLPMAAGSIVKLLIKVDRTWNPLKTLGVPDPRDLGVAVGTIRVPRCP